MNDKKSRRAQKVLIHEKFVPEGTLIKLNIILIIFSDDEMLHDIALVKLERPILQEEWDNPNGQEFIRKDFEKLCSHADL